ncbi:MAG: sterol desaturase family protein [Bdellovibrionales bacterium]|nr:sterol desaturase family protein [Bdellovibrionales bacterium]
MNPENLRLYISVGTLVIIILWELISPKRKLTQLRRQRWTSNIAIIVISTLLVRVLLPVIAIDVAFLASEKQWGLLNQVEWSFWGEIIFAFVVLDFTIYWQHYFFHKVPLLWRLHRVHHSDVDFDVTTGNRFHPIEILLSMGIKMGVVLLVGAPVLSVLFFEIVLNAVTLFNHGNINLPKPVDKVLRYLIVPPDMHRIHHSTIQKETDSNFSFNFPIWDHLFKTYCAEPKGGQAGMHIGLDDIREPKYSLSLWGMLKTPFLDFPAPSKDKTP